MPEPPLLLKDLAAFSEEEVGLAVLGDPIAHSISPQLHNAALKDLSRADSAYDKWRYDKIEVSPAQLEVALPKLAELGYRGINLTIPHKVEIFSIIDSFFSFSVLKILSLKSFLIILLLVGITKTCRPYISKNSSDSVTAVPVQPEIFL